MTTIYAAVIEWPADLAGQDPSLILASSIEERAAGIIEEIRDTADALDPDAWTEALRGIDSTEWPEFIDALEATRYGSPFITTYEREFPA